MNAILSSLWAGGSPKTELGVSVWVWSSSTESTTSKSKNHGVGGHFWVGGYYLGYPLPPKTPKKGVFGVQNPKMAKMAKKCIYVRLSASSFCHFFKNLSLIRGGGGTTPWDPPGGVPKVFCKTICRLRRAGPNPHRHP